MKKTEEKAQYKVLPTIRRMLRIMKEEKPVQIPRIIILTITLGLYPFMEILLPKIAIGTIEKYGDRAVNPLVKNMIIFFLIAGSLALISGVVQQVTNSTNIRIRLRYLGKMSRKMQTMEYKYVEDSSFQEKNYKALNACNNNADGVEGVYNTICKMPAELLTVVGMMVMVCFLNPVILVVLALHTAAIMWASRKSHNYRYNKKEDIAKATRKMKYYSDTTNNFAFGKDIRIFNLRDRILSNYRIEIDAYTSLMKNIFKKEWLYGLLGVVTMLISNVAMYGLLIYYSYNGMQISYFTMYVFLISALMERMVKLGEDIAFIKNQGQYVSDFFRLMDEELVESGSLTDVPDQVEIRFDHVTFRYPNTDKDIFKDFSFTIKKGERLAIVGVNGAGKTTLVKLMCGLYHPTEGHIYINDVDIREYDKNTLYNIYGTVFQDFSILAFSVKENVAATSENIDEDRVKLALESVGLGKKLEDLPKGLDTMMLKVVDEEGTDFSGGERQKLAIARALYKDAPMVIMDEPTAALDALAEADIYQNFSQLVEGKTAVYISHRLASTKFCDKIALFDGEGLREYGTHDELMEMKGMYYDMFVVQGKYYQEEETVA